MKGEFLLEDLKAIFASNLINLRTQSNMTQVELAKKINYSDKSISKWERAESIPDVSVVKNIADLFNVSVDFLINSHDEFKLKNNEKKFNTSTVISLSMLGIWTLAMLIFVIFWIIGTKVWMTFFAAAPVSLITLLVLNSIWNNKKYNMLIVLGILLSTFVVIYIALYRYNPWQLVFVIIPASVLTFLSFKVKKR